MPLRVEGQVLLHSSKLCVPSAFRKPACRAVASSKVGGGVLVVRAAGKTRVVRGKCYVTRDVSASPAFLLQRCYSKATREAYGVTPTLVSALVEHRH